MKEEEEEEREWWWGTLKERDGIGKRKEVEDFETGGGEGEERERSGRF